MGKWRRFAVVAVLFSFLLALAPNVFADSTYVVQPGDNLFRIALRHGLTTEELARANGIVNTWIVYAGQVLIIPEPGGSSAPAPAPAEPAPSSTAGNYVIQRGDTLFSIAVKHGVSTAALAQANGITNTSLIYAGQTLTIPGGDSTSNPAPAPVPAPVSYGNRWVDVNLSNQTLTAYQDTTPVYNAIISSGAWPYLTVTGQFPIYLRYQSQDMDGYRLGYDYYLSNVPYVQYFYRDFALHGTYWHNNFGTPMSHGCVNLTIADAQWLYNWATYGTVVNVHY